MKYTLVDGNDWTGLYIDGKLETEDHRLEPDEIIRIAIAKPPTDFEAVEADYNWMAEEGTLPEILDDVQVAP